MPKGVTGQFFPSPFEFEQGNIRIGIRTNNFGLDFFRVLPCFNDNTRRTFNDVVIG